MKEIHCQLLIDKCFMLRVEHALLNYGQYILVRPYPKKDKSGVQVTCNHHQSENEL